MPYSLNATLNTASDGEYHTDTWKAYSREQLIKELTKLIDDAETQGCVNAPVSSLVITIVL